MSYRNIFKILYLMHCYLDVHRTFRKIDKINITKFQKVEFFFVCVIHLYTFVIFEIIFRYRLLQDID